MTQEQDMNTRVSRLEWRADAVDRNLEKQDERIAGMLGRMDAHHSEVMASINDLKEDKTLRAGAEQERERRAEARQRMIKWGSLIVGVIGLLIAMGYFGGSAV